MQTQTEVDSSNKAITLSQDIIKLQDLEKKCDWLAESVKYFEDEDMSFTASRVRCALVIVRAKLHEHRERMLKLS